MVHVDLARAQQRRIKSHLKQGGIIAYPTESCFGLGVSPFCSRGIHPVSYTHLTLPTILLV